jgi:hypothetical protein
VPAADTNSAQAGGSQEGMQRNLQDAGKKWNSPQNHDEDYDYHTGDSPSRMREVDPRFIKQTPSRLSGGGFGSINAGVGGGLAMMAIAVIWFVVGFAFGIIFWYPAVLFVIGLIAVFKGLAGSNE